MQPRFEEPEVIQLRRVQDAWNQGAPSVRELATFAPIQELLGLLYGRKPIPFQTLDFKWGSQQPGHSDSLHFSCLPARFMCGVWVALEDAHEANGPLFYYPGSHKLPEATVYDLGRTVRDPRYPQYEAFQRELMEELGIEPVEFHARKGSVLIWSSNIVHGGQPVTAEGSTRWSQVTHYYFEDCIYYTPYLSEIPTGELFLKDIVDLNTLEPVDHSYDGRPLVVSPLANGRSRLSMDADAATLDDGAAHREQVVALEAQLRAAHSELDRLRRSRSFRLGNAMLEPLRALRKLLG
jgi:8-oxo-dGTP pyrophosphatase MutT (NUDIX family)